MSKLLFVHTKQTLHLALPLIATLLAQMGLVVVDTIMMGHLGVAELAAGSLSHAAYGFIVVFFIGIVNAAGIFIARNHGANDKAAITQYLNQGLFVALLLGVIAMLLFWYVPTFYLLIGQDKSITKLVHEYLFPMSFSMPALMLYILSKEFTSIFLYTRVVMWIAAGVIPVGVLFNYILMYGKWGFPVLGIQGIGIATLIIEWGMLFILWGCIFKNNELKEYITKLKWLKLDKEKLIAIFKLGLPIGIMMIFEEGLFAVSAVMMGYFGEISLAAHQITILCVTFFFMIQLGLSQTVTILTAKSLGARQAIYAKHFVYIALVIGLFLGVFVAAIYLVFAEKFIIFFMRGDQINLEVLNLAVKFFIMAAVFQLFDSIQVISFGALRGYNDTYIPMYLGGFSYWIFGLSAGYILAFHSGFAGMGLWSGLAIGIAISACLLFLRLRIMIKKTV